MLSSCTLLGLIVYASFAGCDPLSHPDSSKRIKNSNQLVGQFVVDHFANFPGMIGLFLASLFCGSLSSVSSSLSSQAAIVWHDILQPHSYFKKFDDQKSLTVNKLLVLSCGVVATGLAFFIATIGGNLLQISTSFNGAFASPIMGLFLLGMLFSISTPRGVFVGTLAGFLTALWLGLGAFFAQPIYPKLELSIGMCPNRSDFTPMPDQKTSGMLASDFKGFSKIYTLSFMLYMPFGILVTVAVGLVASLIDGGFRKRSKKQQEYIYYDLLGVCFKNKYDFQTQF